MSEQASWKRLGLVAPESLAAAKSTLHWAVRIAAATDALKPAAEVAPGLEWMESVGCLVGPPLGAADGRSVGLRLSDLCLIVLSRDGEEDGQLALDNLSADNALMWMKFALGVDEAPTMDRSDLPENALAEGAVFDALDDAAFGELARWYGNAAAFLEEIRAQYDESSEIRCSPTSLELSTAIEIGPGGDSDDASRIVIGMMPGGEEFAAPHWFVRPEWSPESAPEESLPGGGSWHAGDWVGAVLPAAAVVAVEDASGQRDLVDEFVRAAIEQLVALLG